MTSQQLTVGSASSAATYWTTAEVKLKAALDLRGTTTTEAETLEFEEILSNFISGIDTTSKSESWKSESATSTLVAGLGKLPWLKQLGRG